MNKDSQILTKIFNMADEFGLYCTITKRNREVLCMYIGEKTFFPSDCVNNSIHDAYWHNYTYKDLKKYLYKYKENK